MKEPLQLKHRTLLNSRLKKMGVALSEYTFANLYLFRNEHNYEVITSKDIYIKGKTRDGLTFLMPTVTFDKIDFDDLKISYEGCDFLFPIPEEWRSFFDKPEYEVTYLDQDSDYIYLVEKMSTYAGRALSGRRNLTKQFLENFPDQESLYLETTRINDAIVVLEAWQQQAEKQELFTDYLPCKEALMNFKELDLEGYIVYVEKKPVGFLIGEPLTENMYVIHFAKGLTEYKGIYQFLYQEFAKTLQPKYLMINMEQDLGLADLRHAKTAYLPERLAPGLRVKIAVEI
jgi:hypothetical protein